MFCVLRRTKLRSKTKAGKVLGVCMVLAKPSLTHCMLGSFSCFCCRQLTFYQINFFKKFFQEYTYYQSVKLFVKVSANKKLPLAKKEFVLIMSQSIFFQSCRDWVEPVLSRG